MPIKKFSKIFYHETNQRIQILLNHENIPIYNKIEKDLLKFGPTKDFFLKNE